MMDNLPGHLNKQDLVFYLNSDIGSTLKMLSPFWRTITLYTIMSSRISCLKTLRPTVQKRDKLSSYCNTVFIQDILCIHLKHGSLTANTPHFASI